MNPILGTWRLVNAIRSDTAREQFDACIVRLEELIQSRLENAHAASHFVKFCVLHRAADVLFGFIDRRRPQLIFRQDFSAYTEAR
jgi:hypothetical protein